jgi:HlyD family secretion protein
MTRTLIATAFPALLDLTMPSTPTGLGRLAAWWRVASPYRLWIAAVVGLAALGAWAGPRLLLGPSVPIVEVIRRDFVQSVVASGRVEAPHRVSIGAQVIGTVRRIPVAEGQVVAAGQVLVELDAQEARAATAQADLLVTQGEARLRQLRELQVPMAEQAVRQAQVTLDNARAQLRRQGDLFKQGFIGQAALDDAQKLVDLAQSQWRTAQSQLASLRPGGSDHALASAALAQAVASADQARSRLRYTTIVAPVAGVLISRDVETGDVVQPGKTLMALSPSGETQLVVQIDEKNLHLLKIGQLADASADAFADARFPARIVFINPAVDPQRGSVEVKLAVAQPPDYLTQDMTVSVDIRVAQRPQAVLVPSDALHDGGSARPWVLRVEGRHARRQAVQIGLRGGAWSEVLGGLQPGDRVVPTSVAEVGDGARLRAVPATASAST